MQLQGKSLTVLKTSQHKKKSIFQRATGPKKGNINCIMIHKGHYQVEIAIGMSVMVTENLETDLDITNGTHGKIVGIVLHEDELPIA